MNTPEKPDGMLDYVLKELIEIKSSMAVMQARLDAQEQLIMAGALLIPENQRTEYLKTLTALQLNAFATGAAEGARLMQPQIDRWQALCGDHLQASNAETLLLIHADSALFAQTPARLKQAQSEWLSIATPEELGQELAEKIRPALDAAAAAKKAKPRGSKRKG